MSLYTINSKVLDHLIQNTNIQFARPAFVVNQHTVIVWGGGVCWEHPDPLLMPTRITESEVADKARRGRLMPDSQNHERCFVDAA